MSGDWFDDYLAGGLSPANPLGASTDEADPVLIVGTVMQTLAARGVRVTVDGTLDRAVEAAGRLLRALGVEATDAWPVTR